MCNPHKYQITPSPSAFSQFIIGLLQHKMCLHPQCPTYRFTDSTAAWPVAFGLRTHMHVHMHAHIHTHAHTHAHTCTNTCTHITHTLHTHYTHLHTCTHICMTKTHTHMHTFMYIRAHAQPGEIEDWSIPPCDALARK